MDFYNQINMLYGTINEFCTPQTCPVMSAGPKYGASASRALTDGARPRYEYLWADGTEVKKPIKLSAPEYVDYLMTWVQKQLDDETVFPSKIGTALRLVIVLIMLGVPFPKTFPSVVKNIFKRLFRVYAHIYHTHAAKVSALGEEAHLNTSFKHFVFFVNEFQLIEKKELAPLEELIKTLCE